MARRKLTPIEDRPLETTGSAAVPIGQKTVERRKTIPKPKEAPLTLQDILASTQAKDVPTTAAGTTSTSADFKFNQKDLEVLGLTAPAAAGLAAGGQVVPTPSSADAILQSIEAGLGGAVSGATAGATIGALGGSVAGPAGAAAGAVTGAVIGGLTALVSGGIRSYLGLKASRAANRKNERQRREIIELNEKNKREQQAFRNEGIRYQRKTNAIQSKWNAMEKTRGLMNDMMSRDQNLKDRFLQIGR